MFDLSHLHHVLNWQVSNSDLLLIAIDIINALNRSLTSTVHALIRQSLTDCDSGPVNGSLSLN